MNHKNYNHRSGLFCAEVTESNPNLYHLIKGGKKIGFIPKELLDGLDWQPDLKEDSDHISNHLQVFFKEIGNQYKS